MKADTDKGWFAANPTTNYRVRPPRDQAEINELARTLLPPGAEWQDGFQAPDPEAWRVLAIRLPMRRVARLLTVAAPDADGAFHCMPVALGERMAVS